MKTRLATWVVGILMAGLLATGGCGSGDSDGPVLRAGPDPQNPGQGLFFTESFVQFTFQNFGPHSNQPNTAYGGVTVSFNLPSGVYYYNCVIQSQTIEWQIKNVPLLGLGAPSSVFLPVDLSTLQGGPAMPVPTLNSASLLTTTTLVNPPTVFIPNPVTPRNLNYERGIDDGIFQDLPPPSQRAFSLTAFQNPVVNFGFHSTFVNQECGLKECVPAGVSNSLKTIGVSTLSGPGGNPPGGPLEINDMKIPVGFRPGWGSPRFWFNLKGPSLLASHGVTTTTATVPQNPVVYPPPPPSPILTAQRDQLVSTVLAAIAAGADVEVQNSHHAAMVTAVRRIVWAGRVTFYINVAHDTNQGVMGGLVNELLLYDPATNKFTGGVPGFFPWTSPLFFTTEVKP